MYNKDKQKHLLIKTQFFIFKHYVLVVGRFVKVRILQ
ncbi:MAG: hypothetical protein RLZZ292_1236 [Bacteroidota bacterium]|jgi:hypothetical protein